ncbi:MAG: ATP-binding cassette domain-containing protein [Actinomycetota bacterium]|nr:ATP-binding cassette domain-containing protein [Actinomycetota bacterium]
MAHNYRTTRIGRATLAVRDNERGASSFGVSPMRTKITAFAASGVIAGAAGGLYVLLLQGVPFSGFNAEQGFTVFTMVVIGGLGSLPGAILGAIYVEWAQFFLSGSAQLLATGAGLLVFILAVPGGIGSVIYRIRDRLLRMAADRYGIAAPSLWSQRAQWDGAATSTAPSGGVAGHGHDDGTAPTRQLPEIGELTKPIFLGDGDALTVQGVDARYGQVQVLFSVDARIAEGGIVALLGTNGAGKSTLLRVLSGLMPARSGRVTLFGRDITSLSPGQRLRHGLVTVLGGRGVFPSLTVAENLRMAAWTYRKDRQFVRAATQQAQALFPRLRERANVRASLLSGGEQQMLCMARALLCKPRVLLIDELSLGLAPAVVASLLEVVRRLNRQGVTVVLVEQSVNIASSVASDSIFMERGQVRFQGSAANLVDRPDLARAVFLQGAVPGAGVPAVAGDGMGTHRMGTDGVVARRHQAGSVSPPALELQGIGVSYGGVRAVDQVSLSVHGGEILGIIGSNGAGKTTLFDVCSGFLSPDAGRIHLWGQDVTRLAAWERAELGMGRIFQDARLFPALTVAENLAVAFDRHVDVREPIACMLRLGPTDDSERGTRDKVDALLDQTGLERYRDAFVSELSTGTRRIVEIACAMAHRPSLLLLDEPTSGVAQRESEAMAQLVLRLHQETAMTFVIIEHDVPLVASISDRLVCMHLGRVIADGEPADVLAEESVITSYLGGDDAAIRRSDTRTPGGAGVKTPAGA